MCGAESATFTQEERESAAVMNSQEVEKLIASKGLVKVRDNGVPRQGAEKRLPRPGCNVLMTGADAPDWDDTTG